MAESSTSVADRSGPSPNSQRAPTANGQTNDFREEAGAAYTVVGKGGLVREVRLSGQLAKELERTRLSEPRIVVDRGIKYRQHYNLSGCVYFSFIFGKTSKEVLGWSTGAHGLRHGYAQDRMTELLELGFAWGKG